MTTTASPIFISYRRVDAKSDARWLYTKLVHAFGGPAVFMDVKTILPGAHFPDTLAESVRGCTIVVALIGPQWTAEMTRRAQLPEIDFVFRELSLALAEGKRILPVLLDGMKMPDVKDLPSELAALAAQNALEIHSDVWHLDDERLVQAVEQHIGTEWRARRSRAVALTHTIPPPPEFFVGREETLRNITTKLAQGKTLALLNGVRGIGKTAVARQYFHDHRGNYRWLVWVTVPTLAAGPGDLNAAFIEAGIERGLRDATGPDFQFQVTDSYSLRAAHAWRALGNLPDNGLLVLDSANDAAALERFFAQHPPLPGWHLLLTSTAQTLDKRRFPEEKIGLLDPDRAAEVFIGHHPPAAAESEALRNLLQRAGRHTLVVEMLAKNLARLHEYQPGVWTVTRLTDALTQQGLLGFKAARAVFTDHQQEEKEIRAVLDAVFDIAPLPEAAQVLLHQMAHLPGVLVEKRHLSDLFSPLGHLSASADESVGETSTDPPFDETLRLLVRAGWLDDLGEHLLFHAVSAEVVRCRRRSAQANDLRPFIARVSVLVKSTNATSFEPYKEYYLLLAELLPDDDTTVAELYFHTATRYEELGIYENAMLIFEKSAQISQNADDKYNYAATLGRLGELWRVQGNFEKALDFFEKQTVIFEQLHRENPRDQSLKNGLSISCGKLGELWQAQGDFEKTFYFFEKQTLLAEQLYQKNPRNHNLKTSLAISYAKLGELWQAQGDFEKAFYFFEKQTLLDEQLYQENLQDQNLKNNLSISYVQLGELWREHGDFKKALDFFEKATVLSEDLHRENPRDQSLKNGLSISYGKLGELWEAKRDFEKAFYFFEKVTVLFEDLHRENPRDHNLKNNLALSYAKLGELWQAQENFEKTFYFFEKATMLFEDLHRENPLGQSLKNSLALLYGKLGELRQAQGGFEKAFHFFEKATVLFENLHRENPYDQRQKNGLAISYFKLGVLWKAQQDFQKALDFFEKETLLFEQLHRENPRDQGLKNGLAISYWKLADLALAMPDGDHKMAVQRIRQCRDLWLQLWEQCGHRVPMYEQYAGIAARRLAALGESE